MSPNIFDCLGISIPDKPKLRDLLEEPTFQHVVPLAVRYKFDAVRIHGNAGAHGRYISEETSLWLLHETFQLVCWFFLSYICREKQPCPEYQTPLPPAVEPARHAIISTDEEDEGLRYEAPEFPVSAENRLVKSISLDVSELPSGKSPAPLADVHAMLIRQPLRDELGKQSQESARYTGEKAATALHLDESPAPE